MLVVNPRNWPFMYFFVSYNAVGVCVCLYYTRNKKIKVAKQIRKCMYTGDREETSRYDFLYTEEEINCMY